MKGSNIPGVHERLMTTLFANDTTVYLSEFNHCDDLRNILDTWCIASGEKFNIAKTEVLPIGSPIYCSTVIRTHGIHPSQEPLMDGIYIVEDKELLWIHTIFVCTIF